MRFKVILEIDATKFGNILPISYQYELVEIINKLFQADPLAYQQWLKDNNLDIPGIKENLLYSISNLYIPKIFVDGDRLHINVPRIQFWISVLPEFGTEKFISENLLGKEVVIGDQISKVAFRIGDIQIVTPVIYRPRMEFQTLSPLVVVGLRPNKTIEFLSPHNIYFGEFMVENLIERWEFLNQQPFMGDRRFSFQILQPERRKAVTVYTNTDQQQKVVGYMMKFRLTLDPCLQEIAYVLGLGDKTELGFGYIELLKKESR